MKFYLAPMEGITGFVYRNAVISHFGENISKYFTPFIETHIQKDDLNSRELRDICPENNPDIMPVPQIMSNSAVQFLHLEKKLRSYGYNELNINLGCPAKTVVTRGRGAGFLKEPEKLREFLQEVFENTKCRISVKMRLGLSDPSEFDRLLDVVCSFPLYELIVHPRIQSEQYSGIPHYDHFEKALIKCHEKGISICYNGDITDVGGFRDLMNRFMSNTGLIPDSVMIGRGFIKDPFLIERLSGNDSPPDRAGYKAFADQICKGYQSYLEGDIPVLHKMKELWQLMQPACFPGCEKTVKKITRCRRLDEYRKLIETI